jgi:glycosyltransferase involved in cell wall biosynthesis
VTERLRVLFYIGSMDAGGAERQVLELIRHLDRSKFVPMLGLATRQGPLLAEVPEDVRVYAFQETSAPSRRFGLNRLLRWTFLSGLLRRERIDVVYDRTFLATLDSGPATWWRRTPRISAIVADPMVQMALYFPRRQWFWRRLARWVYRTANLVLVNSQGLREQVIDYFRLPTDRVRVLSNALNLRRLDELASRPLAMQSERFRILTVGRIDRHKGHRDLLEAVRILVHDRGQTQILWQILGDGPERASLWNDVCRLKLGEQVEWLGIVENPYPFYRGADVFCLPSLSEGSPNVLLEALALGTPVISTDCPFGPREILEDGRWGFLAPMHDPTALALAIMDCMVNRATWRQRAAEAKPVIRERYDVKAVVRRLENVLLEVAGEADRLRPVGIGEA